MRTLYENYNNDIDPKICYLTKTLEPAAYWCRHSETHNRTHLKFTEMIFDLTQPLIKNKLKTFVWTSRKEGTYCVGKCELDMNEFTNPNNCTWTLHHCFNLTTCGYNRITSSGHWRLDQRKCEQNLAS